MNEINKNVIEIGVCEGRHEMPVSEFIFGQELDPTAVDELEATAEQKIRDLINARNFESFGFYGRALEEEFWIGSRFGEDDPVIYRTDCEIRIYATGLTVAVLAVVKAACKHAISVSVMHYNRGTNTYYEQKIQ